MNQEDVYKEEKARLVANILWFNRFFRDLRNLLDRMGQRVGMEMGATGRSYYYPKTNKTPAIPDYLLMGMNGDTESLQIYAVLQPAILTRPFFKAEPSFVVIRIFQPGIALYVNDFGWRVISQDNSVNIFTTTPHLSGQLQDGHQFQAFQMALDPFMGAVDADATIDLELRGRFKQLPDLGGGT